MLLPPLWSAEYAVFAYLCVSEGPRESESLRESDCIHSSPQMITWPVPFDEETCVSEALTSSAFRCALNINEALPWMPHEFKKLSVSHFLFADCGLTVLLFCRTLVLTSVLIVELDCV